MRYRNAALAAVALASIVTGVFRISARLGSKPEAPRVNISTSADLRLAPAVVIARKPTVTELLDLILRERPTAAEMMGRSVKTGFPEGSDEAHISGILGQYTTDRIRADRIAAALVKEGRRRNVGSSLLLGVLLVENPWLNPRARSGVGARGLMQVMPFHAGKWGCGSRDLFDIESNICHGVAVLADNLSQSKTLPQALLGYNGCVRGTNTPDCHRYPRKVFGYARKGASGDKAFPPGFND